MKKVGYILLRMIMKSFHVLVKRTFSKRNKNNHSQGKGNKRIHPKLLQK